jgi:hypothetical protein
MLTLFFRHTRTIEPANQWVLSQAPKEEGSSTPMQATYEGEPMKRRNRLLALDSLKFDRLNHANQDSARVSPQALACWRSLSFSLINLQFSQLSLSISVWYHSLAVPW